MGILREIIGWVAELVLATVATYLAEQYVNPRVAVLVGLSCVAVLSWLHWGRLEPLYNSATQWGTKNRGLVIISFGCCGALSGIALAFWITAPSQIPKKEPSQPAAQPSSSTEGDSSSLDRPYFSSSPGDGGFSLDKSTHWIKLTIPLMNNSLHPAFDLRTRLVLVEQGNFAIRAAEDTALAGEISPMQQTAFFWQAPKYEGKKIPAMPPMYVVLALQYSGQPDLPEPRYAQVFWMKWAGINDGIIAPQMQYLEILRDHPKPANEGHLKTGQR